MNYIYSTTFTGSSFSFFFAYFPTLVRRQKLFFEYFKWISEIVVGIVRKISMFTVSSGTQIFYEYRRYTWVVIIERKWKNGKNNKHDKEGIWSLLYNNMLRQHPWRDVKSWIVCKWKWEIRSSHIGIVRFIFSPVSRFFLFISSGDRQGITSWYTIFVFWIAFWKVVR